MYVRLPHSGRTEVTLVLAAIKFNGGFNFFQTDLTQYVGSLPQAKMAKVNSALSIALDLQ